mgnify:CR=1 FL=1
MSDPRTLTVRVTNYWLVCSWDDRSYAEYRQRWPGTQSISLQNGMRVILPSAFLAAVEMEGWGAIRGGMLAKTEKGWELTPKDKVGTAVWGYDARGRGLVPFHSIAVPTNVIPLGSHWKSDWAGKVITPDGPWNGIMDAVDVGGGIKAKDADGDGTPEDIHVDLFVGKIADRVDEHYATGLDTPNPWLMTLTEVPS